MCPSHFTNRAIVLVLMSTVLVWACKITRSNGQDPDPAKKIATEILGSDIESFPNSTGEYLLFIQKGNFSHATNALRFLVIHNTNNKVVVEQSFVPGYVKWITETSLEVLSVPGTIKETETLSNYIKIIDIRSNKS